MKRLLILLLCPFLLLAERPLEPVQIGAHVVDIYNVDWENETVDIAFWVWFLYDGPDQHLIQNIGVADAYSVEEIYSITNKVNGKVWSIAKRRCQIQQHWNLKNFPFVNLDVVLGFEPSFHDIRIDFEPMIKETDIAKEVQIPSFKERGFKWTVVSHDYKSTMGDPRLRKEMMLPTAALNIHFTHQGWGLFLRLFSIMYLSYLLAQSIFFIPPTEINAKTCLMIGAVFSAIANHFLVQTAVPPEPELMLVDKLQLINGAFIFISIIVALISKFAAGREHIAGARRVEVTLGFIAMISFLGINGYLIKEAL